jgi:photosystem II stability/assembly factor-like uncharacterized protein
MKRPCYLTILLLIQVSNIFSQSWQRVQLMPDTDYSPAMLDGKLFNDTGVVMGGYGKIFYSTDFFQTFSIDTNYNTHALSGMEFVNRDTGYISTIHVQGGFLVTMDGGITWQPLSYGPPAGAEWGNKIRFAKSDTTAYSSSTIVGFVYRIDMNGPQFTDVTPQPSNVNHIMQIRITNDSTIYALSYSNLGTCGGFGLNMIRSVDYGSSWQLVAATGLNGGGDFCFLDDSTIIAVGEQKIIKSINSGDSFKIVMQNAEIGDGVDCNMNAVYFVNHDTGFVAFINEVYKTFDAGDTWIKTDFAFDSNDVGNRIEFITGASSQKLIVGCKYGSIYKTENGGGIYTGITETKPLSTFTLYPNPTTDIIKILLSDNASAYKVEVSNILSQTLYSAYPRNNEIEVSNLVPGIYLLRLTANGISQTAKFVKQ